MEEKLFGLNKKLMLIINPVAGKRAMAKALAEVTEIFTLAGYMVSVFPTTKKGDATEYVKSYGSEFDLICCSGGDGTMNETVTGIIEAGLDIPIGYMPSGSTNDFAEFHGLSTNVAEAAENIVKGKVKTIDVGELNGRYFINSAEFGAFTWLPYTTPQNRKNFLGFYAYILEGIRDLSKLQSQKITFTINGKTYEGDYAFGAVASSSFIADRALELFREPVVANDGLFEVLLIKKPASPLELEGTVNALRNSNLNTNLITFCRSSEIKVSVDGALDWTFDGELRIGKNEHSIKMLPERIKLVC